MLISPQTIKNLSVKKNYKIKENLLTISIHTIGITVSSNGFKSLLNFDLPTKRLSCILECARIGTPSCYKLKNFNYFLSVLNIKILLAEE